MHARLYLGKDKEKIHEVIISDTGRSLDELLRFELKKIEHVRKLSQQLKLSATQKRIYLFEDFDEATKQAMNAFLKILEEPKQGVSYILTASREGNLLPTILSRVTIKRVDSTKSSDLTEYDNFINKTLSEKLKHIDLIKKRDEADKFLEQLIYYMHHKMIDTTDQSRRSYSFMIDQALKSQKSIAQNGNVNLHLSRFVILIDR